MAICRICKKEKEEKELIRIIKNEIGVHGEKNYRDDSKYICMSCLERNDETEFCDWCQKH